MPTRQDYLQEIADTVGYESDLTGSLCQRFIAATRAIIMLTPAKSSTAQGGVTRFDSEYDIKTLKEMLQMALRWQQQLQSTNPNALIQTAQVPRQFGLERLRRTEWQDGAPNDGNYPQYDRGSY
jgi:hypothetical protein